MRGRAGRVLALLASGLAILLAAALLAGCGSEAGGGGSAEDPGSGRSTQSMRPSASSQPPPVIVSSAGKQLSLRPGTYCWTVESARSAGNGPCVDGAPSEPLPDLGRVSGEITVAFGVDGWAFQASSQDARHKCAEAFPAAVRKVSGRVWQIALAGPRGRYAVQLFGRGPQGDVAVSFAVQTSVDRPSPAPVASLTTFYLHGSKPDATSFDLVATYLGITPKRSHARLTITSDDGRRSTYNLTAVASEDHGHNCGNVALSAAAPKGRVLEKIGGPPYALLVDLDLDGRHYSATATWPDDVDKSESIPLHFSPPLPARR
jgi:hypothetical protein